MLLMLLVKIAKLFGCNYKSDGIDANASASVLCKVVQDIKQDTSHRQMEQAQSMLHGIDCHVCLRQPHIEQIEEHFHRFS